MAAFSHPSKWVRSVWFWVLLAAVSAFVVAVGGSESLSAAISAGIGGAISWWFFIERTEEPTYRNAVKFGFVAVMLASFFWLPVAVLLGLPTLSHETSPYAPFPSEGLLPTFFELREFLRDWITLFGLSAFAGIITIPLGIIAGLILVTIRRRI